jgi:hypothetical protein
LKEQVKDFSFVDEMQANDTYSTDSNLFQLEARLKNITTELAITGRLLTFVTSYSEVRELEDLSAFSQSQNDE